MPLHLTTLDRYMPDARSDPAFWRRRLFGFGLSVCLYVLLVVLAFLQGLNSEFGNIKFTDEKAEQRYKVAWVGGGKKLTYPYGFFAPSQTKSLAEIEHDQELEAKRKRERERRRALAEAKQREDKAKQLAKNNDQSQSDKDGKSGGGGNSADGPQSGAPSDVKPSAVAINLYPLRTHIDDAVDKFRKGKLNVDTNSLHGTVSIGVDSKGDFGEVKMIRSSGSPTADETAKASFEGIACSTGNETFFGRFYFDQNRRRYDQFKCKSFDCGRCE